MGHFVKVCRKTKEEKFNAATSSMSTESNPQCNMNTKSSWLASVIAGAPACLSPAIVTATLKEKHVDVLVDSGAFSNFVDYNLVSQLKLPLKGDKSTITMASQGLKATTLGTFQATICLLDRQYDLKFDVMDKLCADVVLGQAFLGRHSEASFLMGGADPPLKINEKFANVAMANVEVPYLFEFLSENCKPVASRSRSYSKEDKNFIEQEIKRLLDEDIIEPSRSPWRAQVLVVQCGEKKHLVIDYSTTINQYTALDAYPLPRIEELVNKIACDKYYSSIDLCAAYHQVPLKKEERIYTAFEACGKLYHYKQLPSGVTNGVSAFQRVIDDFIKCHDLKKVYAYLDDITVTGATAEEHDHNLKRLLDAAKSENLTLNKEKSKFKVT